MVDSINPGVKKIFPKFFAEIKKYPSNFHEFNPGADLKLIDRAEKKLKVTFPKKYCQLLGFFNGAVLFGTGIMILGVEDAKGKVRNVEGLIESNQPKAKWPGMPKYYLVIAKTSIGDFICLDLKSKPKNDAKVVLWDHEDGSEQDRWSNLAKWLDYEMEEGKALYDYKGNLL